MSGAEMAIIYLAKTIKGFRDENRGLQAKSQRLLNLPVT